MDDKFSNAVIILMIIVIIVLGGVYYAKIAQSQTLAMTEMKTYREQLNDGYDTNDENYSVNDFSTIDEDTENKYTQTSSSYPYNNKFYYNQLNEYSKKIYDAVVDNIEELKTGNHAIEVDYDFSSILSQTDGQSLLKEYYDDAINALNLDIPNLFYIDFSKMWLNVETTTTIFSTKYRLFIDSGNYKTYYEDEFLTESQVALAISQVEMNKDQLKEQATDSIYYTVKRIHDKIISDMSYDDTSTQKATVYGALIERKGVCESYSRTFKYVLDELGIENILVTGLGTNSKGTTEEHMWNYVKIYDNWYAVDVTWDDPIVSGTGIQTDEMRHKYFLKGSIEFFKNHEESQTISSSDRVFTKPKLSPSDY